MKVPIKQVLVALILSGSAAGVCANVCSIVPGSVTCLEGTIPSLTGNGVVNVKGTIVVGATQINGVLNAEASHFFTLDVNGSAKLSGCTVNDTTNIKGSLAASATKFANTVNIYSNEIQFSNSQLGRDLHIGHTDSKKQTVYLDNSSEVAGNIIFDDGQGEVILQRQSKIGGKIVGGQTV
jgi:hypothetical protein